MDRDRLAAKLMATFLIEFQEHHQTLNDDLLALENGACSSEATWPLHSLFRTAHSLKGAARAVGLAPIEAACHAMEEILAAARGSQGVIAPSLFPILFETASDPQATYANALVAGVAAIRRIFGKDGPRA